VVATCNSLFSFIAGFAVFATMGHLAFLEDFDSVSELEVRFFSYNEIGANVCPFGLG